MHKVVSRRPTGMAVIGDILKHQELHHIGITKMVYVGNTTAFGTALGALGSQVMLPTWENIIGLNVGLVNRVKNS